ncbi:MAG: deoxyribodipyrimidine photo-lyase [Candidatus Azotimanducaceae bacterium]|jgi:deoxyribodipyrimidine photo-lyase
MQRFEPNTTTPESLTASIRTFFADVLSDEDSRVSPFLGGEKAARARLQDIDPVDYCRSRNYYAGAVTRLSPYIRHGILHPEAVRQQALAKAPAKEIEKFIQELTWRFFWQRTYQQHPEWIWQDIEPYKTGFLKDEYFADLPIDIEQGTTGVACIDHFIQDLLQTGYMHNHTRMYVASYLVHFRRVKWQVGARWFLRHLIDGDLASNNFSWQWVASTFAHKPYFFNLENVAKYCGKHVDCSPERNQVLDATYAQLEARLFPKKRPEKEVL